MNPIASRPQKINQDSMKRMVIQDPVHIYLLLFYPFHFISFFFHFSSNLNKACKIQESDSFEKKVGPDSWNQEFAHIPMPLRLPVLVLTWPRRPTHPERVTSSSSVEPVGTDQAQREEEEETNQVS